MSFSHRIAQQRRRTREREERERLAYRPDDERVSDAWELYKAECATRRYHKKVQAQYNALRQKQKAREEAQNAHRHNCSLDSST